MLRFCIGINFVRVISKLFQYVKTNLANFNVYGHEYFLYTLSRKVINYSSLQVIAAFSIYDAVSQNTFCKSC